MKPDHGRDDRPVIQPATRPQDYEVFAAQRSNADQAGAEVFNNATKHVASRSLDRRVEWQNSILIKGDPSTTSNPQAIQRPGDPGARQRQSGPDAARS